MRRLQRKVRTRRELVDLAVTTEASALGEDWARILVACPGDQPQQTDRRYDHCGSSCWEETGNDAILRRVHDAVSYSEPLRVLAALTPKKSVPEV